MNTATTAKQHKRKNLRGRLLALARQRPGDVWVCSVSKRKACLRVGDLRVVLRKTDSLLSSIRQIRVERVEAAIKRASRIIKSCRAKGRAHWKAVRFLREIIREYRCLVLTEKGVARLKNPNPRIIPLERDFVNSVYGVHCRYYLYIL